MEFRHLRYFESIVRNKKIVKAAEELHISQPSLSMQMKALEQELGCKLFERTSGEIRLTEPGSALYKHANLILQQYKEALQEIQDFKDVQSGEISLGVLPTIVVSWLPQVLSEFKRKYPNVTVHIREMGAEAIEESLKNYDIQMGITSPPFQTGFINSHPVIDEELLLITSKQHALGDQAEIDLQDLENEPFILYEAGYQLRQTVLDACKQAGFKPIVAYQSSRVETIRSFVSAGLGIALIPETSVRFGNKGDIMIIRVKNPTPRRTLCVATHQNRYLSPAMQQFQGFILDFFNSVSY